MRPDRDLIDEERLLAEVIKLNGHIPVGLQIGMPRHLTAAITRVNTLFVAHNLPRYDQLCDELALWHTHAQHGLAFAHECDQIMTGVIRHVSDITDEALTKRPSI